jgi:hypothetical protein
MGFSPFSVSLFGTSGLLVSDIAGQMVIIFDGGKNGQSFNSPCRNNPFRTWVTTPDGIELWALCVGYPNVAPAVESPSPAKPTSMPGSQATDKELYVSQDGGSTWVRKGALPGSGTSASIVSTQPGQLLIGTNATPILLTTDAASHWTQVQTSASGGAQWLRFINPQVGWAMDTQGAIWATTDGGASWTHLLAFDLAL